MSEGNASVASICGLILALFLAACCFFTGCVSDSTPPPAGGGSAQPGVLIQNVGDVTGQGIILQGVPRGTIDTVTFTIGLAPGVKNLDLNNMSIVYTDAIRTETLQPVEGYHGSPPPGYWGIIDASHEVGVPNLRMEFEEQFVIRINPRAAVVPNQVITISVKPTAGKPLILRRYAPSTIREGDNILLAL